MERDFCNFFSMSRKEQRKAIAKERKERKEADRKAKEAEKKRKAKEVEKKRNEDDDKGDNEPNAKKRKTLAETKLSFNI